MVGLQSKYWYYLDLVGYVIMIFGHGQKTLRTTELKDRCDCDMATKDQFPVTLPVDTQLESNLVILIISLVSQIQSLIV